MRLGRQEASYIYRQPFAEPSCSHILREANTYSCRSGSSTRRLFRTTIKAVRLTSDADRYRVSASCMGRASPYTLWTDHIVQRTCPTDRQSQGSACRRFGKQSQSYIDNNPLSQGDRQQRQTGRIQRRARQKRDSSPTRTGSR